MKAPFSHLDLTLRCPTCGKRADVCFEHGTSWKHRSPLRAAESLTTGSAARSGNDTARSADPREEREYPSAASAPPPQDFPDPHYADDLAYADYWENRL